MAQPMAARGLGDLAVVSRGVRRLVTGRNTGLTRRVGGLWVSPVFDASKIGLIHSARVRDLAVSAEAIMTSTTATATAMSHRTQSMPGLPSPPNAV